MNKRTRGILLLAAGFVMLFAAVALYWAYDDRDRLAGETSAALLQELEADPAPPAITEEVTITTPVFTAKNAATTFASPSSRPWYAYHGQAFLLSRSV